MLFLILWADQNISSLFFCVDRGICGSGVMTLSPHGTQYSRKSVLSFALHGVKMEDHSPINRDHGGPFVSCLKLRPSDTRANTHVGLLWSPRGCLWRI